MVRKGIEQIKYIFKILDPLPPCPHLAVLLYKFHTASLFRFAFTYILRRTSYRTYSISALAWTASHAIRPLKYTRRLDNWVLAPLKIRHPWIKERQKTSGAQLNYSKNYAGNISTAVPLVWPFFSLNKDLCQRSFFSCALAYFVPRTSRTPSDRDPRVAVDAPEASIGPIGPPLGSTSLHPKLKFWRILVFLCF